MLDTFTFAYTEEGQALRTMLASSLLGVGRTVREFEETINTEAGPIKVLKLEAGKRPSEGQIAAEVKRRHA